MAQSSQGQQVPEPWKDASARPYLSLRNVTKKFGEFVAVDSVSLDVYQGEIFCLLGASGCGKSTLLRMLAGFETPTSGSILVDGVDMTTVPPYQRPVNMMFQSYALFPHMSVEDNVAFGLKQEGLAKSEIRDRVAAMLELVQLDRFAKRKPHQLSGGQRQRVALARSLVKQPKLLLLDEPLSALDKKLREHTQFELIRIQETLGVTFVVVTHDQQEAMTLSSRIGVMEAGEILQVGTPTEIYEFPKLRYVAEFIGSVNLFKGQVVEDEADHVRIASDEAGCEIFIDHGISVMEGSQVLVALRPEKIAISREEPEQEGNRTQATVEEIAYMGEMSIYHVKLDSGLVVRVTQPNLFRTRADPITWDDRVWLRWHPSSAIVVQD